MESNSILASQNHISRNGSIEKLSEATRARLRSTQILSSLPEIVSELIQNALDADAHHIEIGVDCEGWACWVRDNGCGINKDGLSAFGKGSEEGRYMTSKLYAEGGLINSLSTFGFRGEALASAADISCLEISSRTSKSRETSSIIIKGGDTLYFGSSVNWRRETPGTTVCVRDAFYNLPVRRLSHPTPHKTIELVRRNIELFAIVFPAVSFTIEDTSNAREGGSSGGHLLRIPKTSSSLATFRHLFGRALTEHIDEINVTAGDLKLEGFISLNGAHSKAYQFLYVNRHPIAFSDLHRIIDMKFSSSTFAKHALDEMGELPRSSARRSPRRTEKKPVYVLNLTVPPQDIDNCLEPAKTVLCFQDLTAVKSLLSTSVQDFLSRHQFIREKRPMEGTSSPYRKRRKYDKSFGSSEGSNKLVPTSRICESAISTEEHIESPYIFVDGTEENELTWTDPTTGANFVVDSRTGNSRPQLGRAAEGIPNIIQPRQTLHLQRPDLGPESNRAEMPQWIQQALEVNDAYAIPEGNIPSLKFPSVTVHTSDQHNCHNTSRSQYFGTVDNASSDLPRRFRKEALHQARVINQVDRKFIACLIKDDQEASDRSHEVGGRALVLVDQHAADERVRVERFLKELCLGFLHNRDQHENDLGEAIPVKVLSPPLPLLLTRHEVLRLGSSREMQRAFRNWGFQFEDTPTDGINNNSDENSGYMQLFVRAIPEVVSGKLMLGDELRDLVKGFFAQLEIDEPLAGLPSTSGEEDEFRWLQALRWCPRKLLDLVNSKACRGAIMFNDPLSIDQCRRLIDQLSRTAFPFQCAHGRYVITAINRLYSHIMKAIPRPPPQYWVSLRVKATWAWRSSLVKTESQLLKYFGPMPVLRLEKSIDSLYLSVGAQS